jgi:hypothetical protein
MVMMKKVRPLSALLAAAKPAARSGLAPATNWRAM